MVQRSLIKFDVEEERGEREEQEERKEKRQKDDERTQMLHLK